MLLKKLSENTYTLNKYKKKYIYVFSTGQLFDMKASVAG